MVGRCALTTGAATMALDRRIMVNRCLLERWEQGAEQSCRARESRPGGVISKRRKSLSVAWILGALVRIDRDLESTASPTFDLTRLTDDRGDIKLRRSKPAGSLTRD